MFFFKEFEKSNFTSIGPSLKVLYKSCCLPDYNFDTSRQDSVHNPQDSLNGKKKGKIVHG